MKLISNNFGYASKRAIIGAGIGLGVATAVVGIFAITQISDNADIADSALVQYNGNTNMTAEELSAQLIVAEAARRNRSGLYTARDGIISPKGAVGYADQSKDARTAEGLTGDSQTYAGDGAAYEGRYDYADGGIEGVNSQDGGLRGVDSEDTISKAAGKSANIGSMGSMGAMFNNRVVKGVLTTNDLDSASLSAPAGISTALAGVKEPPIAIGAGNVNSSAAKESISSFARGRLGAMGGSNVGGANAGGLGAGQSGAGGGSMASLSRASRWSSKAAAERDLGKKEAAAATAFDGGAENEGIDVDAEAQVADGGLPNIPNINTPNVTKWYDDNCQGQDCGDIVEQLAGGLNKDMNKAIDKGRDNSLSVAYYIGSGGASAFIALIRDGTYNIDMHSLKRFFREYFDVNGDQAGAKLKSISNLKNTKVARDQFEIVKFLFYREFLYGWKSNRYVRNLKRNHNLDYKDIVGNTIKDCDKDDKMICEDKKTIGKWYKEESEKEQRGETSKLEKIREKEQEILCAIFKVIQQYNGGSDRRQAESIFSGYEEMLPMDDVKGYKGKYNPNQC
jgi:hypothetical protein